MLKKKVWIYGGETPNGKLVYGTQAVISRSSGEVKLEEFKEIIG